MGPYCRPRAPSPEPSYPARRTIPRMPQPLTRRDFLQVTAGAGAVAAVGPTLGASVPADAAAAQAAPMPGDALTGWFDRPMRWAQLTLVENDPGRFDPAVLARLLPARSRRRRLPQRRRHRRLLPDRSPAAPSQRVARRRAIRSARSSPAAARWACTSSRGPIRTRCATRCATAHPDWISVAADGQPRRHWANPELWVTCALGPYNFEFMDQRPPRDRHEVPRGRHLREPLGAAGRRLLLRPLPGELQGRDRPRPAAHDRRARSGAARSSSSGARRG